MATQQNKPEPRDDHDALEAAPLDMRARRGDDRHMEDRIAKLEADVTTIKIDVAVIKLNGATKADLADLRAANKADLADLGATTKANLADLSATSKADVADLRACTAADIADLKAATKIEIAELKVSIAEAKTSIILWVVSAVFLAQLLPQLIKLFVN